jgi:hypothetical protein
MVKLRFGVALALGVTLWSGVVAADGMKISETPINRRINNPIKKAIYKAAVNNKPEIIEAYLVRGYNIDSLDEEGLSALCSAKENGEDEAYNLLVKYGADEYAECMEKAKDLHTTNILTKVKKYGIATLLVGAGVGGIAALGSGGGGNGSSSLFDIDFGDNLGDGDSSSTDYDSAIIGNGTLNTSLNGTVKYEPVLNLNSNIKTLYSESYFKSSKEYSGQLFSSNNSVNYLGGINAAKAFAQHIGYDENGNLATDLQKVTVGIIDTGVWGNHSEFAISGGSKVTGYNFDYGPCSNGDTTNCWVKSGEASCLLGVCTQEIVLLDSNGKENGTGILTCTSDSIIGECSPYNRWANTYPLGYDWDELQYYFYPNDYNKDLADISSVLHGSNVAGIIAANFDGSGNMGVAFANAEVEVVRYDLMASIVSPIKTLINDNVTAVNLSIGTAASASSNASMASVDYRWLAAARETINSYTTTSSGKKDGMIWVKAAGNDGYSQPDDISGIKLITDTFVNGDLNGFNSYSDLLMMVVVAVDVKLDSNMNVTDYSLSSFSNACGVTKNYCIAAPGGAKSDDSIYAIYSSGQPDSSKNYVGMAGTSQAAPVVTGSIAFIKGAYSYMSSEEIIDLLLTTANKSASDYSADKYGAGLLDLGAAVTTYVSNDGTVSTIVGTSTDGRRLNMSNTHLSVTSVFKEALNKALPETIVVYDKYNRPFGVATSNYITTTHSGYKQLKNDVYNIAGTGVQTVTEGDVSLSFAGSAANINGGGVGFINSEYKHGKNVTGFYFSENTKYDSGNYFGGDLKNPFMAFNSAYGVHNTFSLNKNWGFRLEAVTGQNGLYDGDSAFNDKSFKKQAYALNAELQLHKSKYWGLNLTSGILYEDNAMLGMNGDGAFDLSGTNTYNAGISASIYVTPKLLLIGSYYQGYTKSQSFAADLLKTSDIVSESFAFDANYKWSKTTNFGLQVSSPLRVKKGTLSVNFPSGRDDYSETIYRDTYSASLKPDAREYKFAAYINKYISENISLRAETDVRVNPDHQRGENDYRALFGLNWNFN